MRASAVLAGIVLLLSASLLLPGAAASAALPTYDSGAVRLTVEGAMPNFELAQDANASHAASLILRQIAELRPAPNESTTGPMLVAIASPSDVRTYNTSSQTHGGYAVELTANLTVFHALGPLFPPPGSVTPRQPDTPIAPTTLSVSVRSDAATDAVVVATTISNWPWLDPGDLLALDWDLSVPGATSVAGCAVASSTAPTSTTACGPDPLASSASEWGTSLAGVESLGGSRALARLSWSPGPSNAPAPTAVGAKGSGTGSTDVVVADGASAGAPVLFAMDYALAVPALPAPFALHGSLAPYVGGLVGAVLVAVGGLYVWRRRERATIRDL